jgi:uncharacterized protein
MTIEEQIMTRMKESMRSKNHDELGLLRMVKTEAQKAKTAPGFDGKADDAFWIDVIAKYVKQQQRAIGEFEKAGESAKETIEKLAFDIAYLSEFLPKKLGEAETRALVDEAIAAAQATDVKMVGKVMGLIMKQHRDQVDAALVKKLAEEALS